MTKINYLTNDICEFEVLSNYDNTHKYDILSTCFFKMGSHYKNFDVYIRGIKNLVKLVKSQSKYVLRIFIDEHVRADNSLYSVLANDEQIQIVLFKCAKYLTSDFYHIDVFGALVRLFPLFNFDNNDAQNVIVIDIDLNWEDANKLKAVINYEPDKNIKEIVGMGMIDDLLIKKYRPHFFCTIFGVFGVKFDKSIILNFIQNAQNITDKGHYGKRLKPFGYGTDELFLNEYFLYSNKMNDGTYPVIKGIKLGMLLNYDINWFLYHYKSDLVAESSPNTYSNLKYILGKFYKNSMSVEQMFNLIDKIVYQAKSSDPNKIYISLRFYDVINRLYLQKLELFGFEHVKLIYDYFFNIIDCLGIFYFDPTNLNIIDVRILQKNLIK